VFSKESKPLLLIPRCLHLSGGACFYQHYQHDLNNSFASSQAFDDLPQDLLFVPAGTTYGLRIQEAKAAIHNHDIGLCIQCMMVLLGSCQVCLRSHFRVSYLLYIHYLVDSVINIDIVPVAKRKIDGLCMCWSPCEDGVGTPHDFLIGCQGYIFAAMETC